MVLGGEHLGGTEGRGGRDQPAVRQASSRAPKAVGTTVWARVLEVG